MRPYAEITAFQERRHCSGLATAHRAGGGSRKKVAGRRTMKATMKK